ncbi:restriction endonuclease subunit S [Brevibacterium sp. 50QC2O2]|uniref:restriction endonuclease subunit S n=1 Tax=Brevibacterium sp. 50QC2O2 TaxID=2968459 RepID=UPI00211BEAA8|nr:restriction endonuclease subunit S [Brevibacterium sp. 50QC2O2]MCQ9388105.1 restriction endonuclease subunit S [Brevibacterium sp. 50QC2O2]
MSKVSHIGDVSEQIRGVTFKKGQSVEKPGDGLVAVLRAGNIQEELVTDSGLVYVTQRLVHERQMLRPNDVVIATSSGSREIVGKAAAVVHPVEASFGAFLKVLRPKAGVNPRYFFHYFKTPKYRNKISSIAAGANINNLRNSDLDNLEIPLPSLSEQKRIASILDKADAICQKRRAALAHLDSLTQSIFHDMFGHMPANATVAEIVNQKSDIRTGPFGSQLLHDEFVSSGISVLGLDNVVGNRFLPGKERYITQDKYSELKRYTVYPGDVLVSIMGTTGRCVVVPEGIPTSINTKHICAITVDLTSVVPEFLRAVFLWHPDSRRHLLRQTKGSIMSGLNMSIIKAMPVPVPSMDEQVKFSNISIAIEHRRGRFIELLQQDDTLFASLQSRAFKGEL